MGHRLMEVCCCLNNSSFPLERAAPDLFCWIDWTDSGNYWAWYEELSCLSS